jgi:hypothetical protein
MKILQRKARKIVKELVEKNFVKINVSSGECRYNFRCHYNAVHDAINNENEYIAMVWYIEDGYPAIHFLNYEYWLNTYTDNTLGVWSKNVKYYLIKFIHKEDFFSIDDVFDEYRDEVNTWLPFWLRYFISKDSF